MLSFILLIIRGSIAQSLKSELENEVYTTYFGMKNKKPFPLDSKFIVNKRGSKFLEVTDFYSSITKNNLTQMEVFNIWAIRYQNEFYYHLYHAWDIVSLKSFIKFDVIGNYCAFVVEPSTFVFDTIAYQKSVNQAMAGAVVGGGVFGAAGMAFGYALYESFKTVEGNLKNSLGEKSDIYYIDTKKSIKAIRIGPQKFKKLFPQEKELYQKILKKELTVEELLNLIKALNSK
jgi:hypothetical protein